MDTMLPNLLYNLAILASALKYSYISVLSLTMALTLITFIAVLCAMNWFSTVECCTSELLPSEFAVTTEYTIGNTRRN